MINCFELQVISRILLIICCSAQFVFSQSKEHISDSLKNKLQNDSAHIFRRKIIRPFINYQERNNVNLPPVFNFWGPQLGIYFHDRHILAICMYFSSTKTKEEHNIILDNMEVIEKNKVNYTTLLYQYILFRYRFFSLSFPTEIGYGKYNSKYLNLDKTEFKNENRDLFLVNTDIKLTLKPLKWLGISGSFGYRYTNYEILNGYYYAYGIWLGLRPVANNIRYLNKKRKYNKAMHKLHET